MKKALLVVSVLSLVGGNALAAKTAQAVKKSQRQATVKRSRQVKVAAADLALSSNTAVASAATAKPTKPVVVAQVQRAAPPAVLTGSTTVTTAQPVAKPKTTGFGLNWLSYNAMSLKGLENVTGATSDDKEVNGWEQPTIKYTFDEAWSVGVMPQFFHSWLGNPDKEQGLPVLDGQLKQRGSLYMGNTALKLNNSKLAMLPGGIKLDAKLQFDIPTSELSQKAGSYGEAWATVGLARSFGRVDTKLSYIARYYLQRYETSLLIAKDNLPLQNNIYRQYALLDLGYNITDKFSTTLEMGTKLTYKLPDGNTGRSDYMQANRIVNLDFSYVFTKSFTLSMGLFEDGPLSDTRMPFDTTNSADNEFYVAGTFNI